MEETNLDYPTLKDPINWEPLKDYMQESIARIASGKGEPKDFKHWIFEIAMEAMYGKDIWNWYNER